MNQPAVRIQNLGKEYVLGGAEHQYQSFRELLTDSIRAPIRRWRRLRGAAPESARFWALNDLNLDVDRGDIVGLIGRNGAGKSTLLKILSRITAPTRGRIEIRGRVASLLEVATGFHPELSGRENVYLNGAILGMKKREVDRDFDSIVAFAEVESFIDTPVKRYSSGMYVRLAFAVAAHLEPDVLLVDEVLAVGDHAFREKCLGKLQTVAHEGRTVLFVSHNMGSIASLCTSCVVLDKGKLVTFGPTDAAIQRYLASMQDNRQSLGRRSARGPLANDIRFEELSINDLGTTSAHVFSPDQPIRISVTGTSQIQLSDFNIFISICSRGTRLFSIQDAVAGTPLTNGQFRSTVEIPPRYLRPGTYTVGVDGERKGGFQWLAAEDVAQFTILNQWASGYEERDYGPINIPMLGNRSQ